MDGTRHGHMHTNLSPPHRIHRAATGKVRGDLSGVHIPVPARFQLDSVYKPHLRQGGGVVLDPIQGRPDVRSYTVRTNPAAGLMVRPPLRADVCTDSAIHTGADQATQHEEEMERGFRSTRHEETQTDEPGNPPFDYLPVDLLHVKHPALYKPTLCPG